MAEILGIGCTHRPLMMLPDEKWTMSLKRTLADPDLPPEWKDPRRWPAKMREELGDDFGVSAAAWHREANRRNFAETRRVLDEFAPDVVIMWGDDQFENFREDLVPPFAVMAYGDQEVQPWLAHNHAANPWGEPVDMTYRVRGHREAGIHLAVGLIEAGFDMPYAYTPLHHPCPHAFLNTILLLDQDRRGFEYPVVPFHVNAYGRRLIASQGRQPPLSLAGRADLMDPPSPNPARCMEVGAAVARIMAASPWRVALIASSSWSHSFLTDKTFHLWPDVEADRCLYRALQDGDYDVWRRRTTRQIEDSGHQELLLWFCLMGAMEELGRKPDKSEFIESYAFSACVVYAHYLPPTSTPQPRREVAYDAG